jgi:tetratricopeptide (TPR) repeat protein
MLLTRKRFYAVAAMALLILSRLSVAWVYGQDSPGLAENLRLEFREASWFAEELGIAWVFVDSDSLPEIKPMGEEGDIRFIGTRVIELENDDRGNYIGIVEFVPERTGIRLFPPIEVKAGEAIARTASRQIVVGEPYKTDAMSFKIEPNTLSVYEGQPLQVSFEWRCELPMNQMRDVKLYPEFLSNPAIEVVIPRSDAPEESQFGIPVSERRVIAQRFEKGNAFPESLGLLKFDLYLRFREPGRYNLSRTRLQCSRLLEDDAQSNRYAAYFNNALFEAVDRSSPHERIYAESEPSEILVRPLPAQGRLESFSGIFDPNSVDVSVRPAKAVVGQLIEIMVDVRSETCSEMLRLPDMSHQSAMRNRFWVGSEVNEIWRADGRRFVIRARPLTSQIAAFPSLSFQIFDSSLDDYRLIKTEPIPFDVSPRDGLTFFSMDKIPGAQITIAAAAEGIWHNRRATTMGDVLNGIFKILASGVWIWFGMGVAILGLGGAWAKESRRRSQDADYRRKIEAIESFGKAVSKNPNDIESLRRLIGDYFGVQSKALTADDAASALGAICSDRYLIEELRRTIDAIDLPRFQTESLRIPKTEAAADLGDKLIPLLKGSAMALFLTAALGLGDVRADAWLEAERIFSHALQMAESVPDIDRVNAKFAEAALAFERSAQEGIRPGISWYNAGNAWFQAGEVGRSIANYKLSRSRRPFDDRVLKSLQAARGLRVDRFASETVEAGISLWWMRAAFSIVWLGTAALVVFRIRFRTRYLLWATGLAIGLSCLLGGGLLWKTLSSLGEGVIITEEIYARKGPGYAYATAYVDPLHDGLELEILERRPDWLRARLADGSECWLPEAAVHRLAL